MKINRKRFLIFLIGIIPISVFAQPQLVLLKKERVIQRYYAGDPIDFQVKGTSIRVIGYVNNILMDALVVKQDTFKFGEIEKTFAPERHPINGVGNSLVVASLALLLIDQFNWVAVQKNKAKLDRGITSASLVGILVGLPMALIKREGQELGYKYRLFSVDERSPFYRDFTPRSPYLVP